MRLLSFGLSLGLVGLTLALAPCSRARDIVIKLNNAVNAFLKSDTGKAILEQNALQSVGGSPEDLKAFISGELAKWGPVIAAAKITM